MPSELDLLRSLDDEPDTPSAVDIHRAIKNGRRRRVRRTAGYAGAGAVTAIAVAGASVAGGVFASGPAPTTTVAASPKPSAAKPAYTIPGTPGRQVPVATAPTACTLDELTAPGGAPMALVSGADPTGRYIVGRSYPKGGGYQAVLWTDRKPSKVMLPGDVEEGLTDVNTAGTVVGWSYRGSAPLPYAYANGKVIKLAGVEHGSAYAINEAGAIVGDDDKGAALVWPSVTAKPIRLPVPAGTTAAQPRDIDEDGTVVGSLDLSTPYVWFADGTHRPLPMPVVDGKPVEIAQAFHVRNGWVTGMASPTAIKGRNGAKGGPGAVLAVRWNLRTGSAEVTGTLTNPADGVNAQGWQIGTGAGGYATLVAGGEPVRLPGLGKHRGDGTATIASALSDDGRVIAGQSDDNGGTTQPVVWRCT